MTIEEKRHFLKSLGFMPTSENLAHNLEVQCSKGHIFKRSFNDIKRGTIVCPECEKEEKISFLKSLGLTPISENLTTDLTVQCSRGHTFKRAFGSFVSGINVCFECEKEEKIQYLNSLGFVPISEDLGNNLKVQCSRGHTFKRAFINFNKGAVVCPECENKKKTQYLAYLGFSPVSENLGDNLEVQCSKGHIFKRAFSAFERGTISCPECEKEEKIQYLASLGLYSVSDNLSHNLEIECSKGHTFKRGFNNIVAGATKCPICYPDASSAEIELRTFLEEHNISAKNDWSILEGKELDLYIPEHSLAIEFNGIYWHSELQGKYKKYHLEKTQKCLEQNISLLHIFENEWSDANKREIWKSIILGKLGKHNRVFARKTDLRIVQKSEEKTFLEENHLQGSIGSKIALGLYLEEALLCLMSFGKNRMSNDVEWELLRFASKKGISVVGGASKLFKYFLNNFEGGIVSYSDRRYSQGNMYSKLGFTFSHFSEPNYFYFKNNLTLESRQKYQKHKLPKLLENFDPSLTEVENMKNNGYNRIFDCGNSVWKIVR
jgi:uncharacterized protein (UPF0212 family)